MLVALLFGSVMNIPSTPVIPISGQFVQVVEAKEGPIVDLHHITHDQIVAYARIYGAPLNVKEKSMVLTAECEALENPDGTWDATARSFYFKDNQQEDSWGLAQINLPAHPEVTKEQAQDPDFSMHFMADQFSRGHADLWSCWRKLKAEKIL